MREEEKNETAKVGRETHFLAVVRKPPRKKTRRRFVLTLPRDDGTRGEKVVVA